jgi:hypothetical protein
MHVQHLTSISEAYSNRETQAVSKQNVNRLKSQLIDAGGEEIRDEKVREMSEDLTLAM